MHVSIYTPAHTFFLFPPPPHAPPGGMWQPILGLLGASALPIIHILQLVSDTTSEGSFTASLVVLLLVLFIGWEYVC